MTLELLDRLAAAHRSARDGDFSSAAVATEELLAEAPHCLSALRLLAWAQLEQGRDIARETFAKCAHIDPEDSLAHVGQGLWHEARGAFDRATACFVRACELEPQDQRIRKEIVRLGGALPESPLAEGIGLLRAGQYDAATGPLRIAAAAIPSDIAAQLALATTLWHLGGRQQAFNLATNVLATNPHCVKAMLYVLAQEVSGGRTLRTREMAARVEQIDPGILLYQDTLRLVQLEAVLGRYQASRQPGASNP